MEVEEFMEVVRLIYDDVRMEGSTIKFGYNSLTVLPNGAWLTEKTIWPSLKPYAFQQLHSNS